MTQNLKIRAYLKQKKFMEFEIDMKKFTDAKTLRFGVWGPKN